MVLVVCLFCITSISICVFVVSIGLSILSCPLYTDRVVSEINDLID